MSVKNIVRDSSKCYLELSQLREQLKIANKKGQVDCDIYLNKINRCLDKKYDLMLSEQKGLSNSEKQFVDKTLNNIDALASSLIKKTDKYATEMFCKKRGLFTESISFDTTKEGISSHTPYVDLFDKYGICLDGICSGHLVPVTLSEPLLKQKFMGGFFPSFLCRENPIYFELQGTPYYFTKAPDFDKKLNEMETKKPQSETSVQKKGSEDGVLRATACPSTNTSEHLLTSSLRTWAKKHLKDEKGVPLPISNDEKFIPVETDDLRIVRLLRYELHQEGGFYIYLPASLCNQSSPTISLYCRGKRVELTKIAHPTDPTLTFRKIELEKLLHQDPFRLDKLFKQESSLFNAKNKGSFQTTPASGEIIYSIAQKNDDEKLQCDIYTKNGESWILITTTDEPDSLLVKIFITSDYDILNPTYTIEDGKHQFTFKEKASRRYRNDEVLDSLT